ncbi:cubilin-like [Ptychodera flava]|uniref:cubilin-like n=1 Tax=Ptychodera flava TaxID=63121 RepID=UPI00396A6326
MSKLNVMVMFSLKMLLIVFCLLLRITSGEEMDCGGEVISEGRGSIEFRGTPGLDTNECIWTIYISEQSKVTAKIEACTLAVETDGSYEMSYIEVRDGENADDPLIGNYTHWDCSSSESSISIGYASTNAMWIRLVSPTITDEDIYFDLQFDACGGNIKTKGGSVSSPFYPDSYLKGGNCTWTINTYQGTVFSSSFEEFKLRYSEDSIEIGNDVSNGEADIGRYTNDDHPWTVNNTESNTMWITLIAFELPEKDGTGPFFFQLELKVIGGNGGDIFGQKGFIVSPGNPKGSERGIYPNADATYTWNIYSPNGTFVLGRFVDFSLYTWDKVSIFDGDESEPFIEYQHSHGQDEQFNATGNKMVIQLYTVKDEEGKGYGRFELHFEGLLQSTTEEVTGYNGTVHSPLYPLPYPMNVQYTTKISTPSGTIMALEFIELTLRTGDNVSVYDQDGQLLAGYKSGEDLGVLETHTNATFVILYSGNEDITRTGTYSLEFKALSACFIPDDEMNGELYPKDDIYWPGDELMITCHEGYELSTNYTNVTCETDGSWSDDFPTCIVIDCDEPDDVENSEKHGDSYLYDDVVVYKCKKGYHFESNVTYVVCQENGEWSELPACVPIVFIVCIVVIVLVAFVIFIALDLHRRSFSKPRSDPNGENRKQTDSVHYENHGMDIGDESGKSGTLEQDYQTMNRTDISQYATLNKKDQTGSFASGSQRSDDDADNYANIDTENGEKGLAENNKVYENNIETEQYMFLIRPLQDDGENAYSVPNKTALASATTAI